MQSRTVTLLLSLLLYPVFVHAGVPDWVSKAARFPIPQNMQDASAVVLFEEELVTVNSDGSYQTVSRHVVKILGTEGRHHGRVRVGFNDRTRITYLKGWSIGPDGREYDIKEKEAVETSLLHDAYVSDSRDKLLTIPAADVGSVVAYEFRRETSDSLYEYSWLPQNTDPTLVTRLSLRLPEGTGYKAFWSNHESQQPQAANPWLTWEFTNLEPIKPEPLMPSYQAIAPMLVVHWERGSAESNRWEQIGRYFDGLSRDRAAVTPELRSQAEKLTAGAASPVERLAKLAAFVQSNIRYVAIAIGIGGLQPHPAAEVLTNRYGDCKDKTMLLSALISASGYKTYPVLVHSESGVTRPEFPTYGAFNHVIAAIALPDDADVGLNAPIVRMTVGRLLLFDPTSTLTPFGSLPMDLQGNFGLLVHEGTGELIRMPIAPPGENLLDRRAQLKLTVDGSLSGTVEEVRLGDPAAHGRNTLLQGTYSDRDKALEAFLSTHLGGGRLTNLSLDGLDQISHPLKVRYEFVNDHYSRRSGKLVTVRPRVLGSKWPDLIEEKPRRFPIDFGAVTDHRDRFEIELPAGFKVVELPDPVKMKSDFAEYSSKTNVASGKLIYEREYRLLMRQVPAARVDEVRKFFRAVANDERNAALLEASPGH